MTTEIVNAETFSGFPIARMFYLTTQGDVFIVNLVTEDGRNIRQEVSRPQVASFVAEAVPHVVRA